MLNAKLRYAIMAMMDIASQLNASNIRASDIAKRQNISEKILEAILPQLKRQGFLKVVIGPGGGYKLNKDPKSIFLRQIIDATNEEFKVTRCKGYGHDGCLSQGKKCDAHDLWYLLERKFYNFLEKISIYDIISNNLEKNEKCNFKEIIYLDHNATTDILDYPKEKFIESLKRPLNASSIHYNGQIARKIIEESRENIKNNLNAGKDYNLIFTSSGTETNNLVFHSFQDYRHIVSAIEHPSVLYSTKDPIKIRVNSEGVIDLLHLEEILQKSPSKKIVSVMAANNETGIIQPIKKIAEITHKHGGIFHTDAVQAVGKISFDVNEIDADLITISSHKIGGGFGAAALIYKKNLKIMPMLKGGNQESGLRAGTENIPAIAAFSAASSFTQNSINNMKRIEGLRDYLEFEIAKKIPSAIVCSQKSERLPNTSCIIIPGLENNTQLIHFDLNNICVSSGSACSSGKVEVSHVLLSMSYSEELAKCAIRISLGGNVTKRNLNDLIESWVILYNNL